MSVPAVATEDAEKYIGELYLMYGDAGGMDSFGWCLISFPNCVEDFDDRRTDFMSRKACITAS